MSPPTALDSASPVACAACRRLLIVAAAVASLLVLGVGAAAAARRTAGQPDFGPNVLIFDPSMPTSQIQSTVDAIAAQQGPNQFGSQRYALLFKPGTYGTPQNPLNFQVGYYTSVAGPSPSGHVKPSADQRAEKRVPTARWRKPGARSQPDVRMGTELAAATPASSGPVGPRPYGTFTSTTPPR
jgi:hypothetical protein